MYKTEQAFSKQIVKALSIKFPMVLRIESGETGRGFPDIYCVGPKGEQWFELKNCPKLSIRSNSWVIPWRTGQQAWHLKYLHAYNKQRNVLTLVALKDGFLIIPMVKRFVHNTVLYMEAIKCDNLKELLSIC